MSTCKNIWEKIEANCFIVYDYSYVGDQKFKMNSVTFHKSSVGRLPLVKAGWPDWPIQQEKFC